MLDKLNTANIVTYNATITACGKGKQWETALVLLQEAVFFLHVFCSTIFGSSNGHNIDVPLGKVD